MFLVGLGEHLTIGQRPWSHFASVVMQAICGLVLSDAVREPVSKRAMWPLLGLIGVSVLAAAANDETCSGAHVKRRRLARCDAMRALR
jgi:hypothetical protein